MTYNLSDLERDANKRYEAQKARLRERYKLARDLGFSGAEAGILCLKSEDIIRRLADERKKDEVI